MLLATSFVICAGTVSLMSVCAIALMRYVPRWNYQSASLVRLESEAEKGWSELAVLNTNEGELRTCFESIEHLFPWGRKQRNYAVDLEGVFWKGSLVVVSMGVARSLMTGIVRTLGLFFVAWGLSALAPEQQLQLAGAIGVGFGLPVWAAFTAARYSQYITRCSQNRLVLARSGLPNHSFNPDGPDGPRG